MKLIKALWYGLFIDYHIRKRNRFQNSSYLVSKFHHELASHYYKKAYGKDFQ